MCEWTRPLFINFINLVNRILILDLFNLELQSLIGVKGTDLLYLLFNGRVSELMKQLDRRGCVNFPNRFIHHFLFIVRKLLSKFFFYFFPRLRTYRIQKNRFPSLMLWNWIRLFLGLIWLCRWISCGEISVLFRCNVRIN